jgi:hypothetical protein
MCPNDRPPIVRYYELAWGILFRFLPSFPDNLFVVEQPEAKLTLMLSVLKGEFVLGHLPTIPVVNGAVVWRASFEGVSSTL